MGLADLKKSSTQSDSTAGTNQRKLQMSLEEFIDDATCYAAGYSSADNTLSDKAKAEVIDLASHFSVPESLPVSSAIGDGRPKEVKKVLKGSEPFRKATFTLSESAISHLAELASGCDVAKSKLIRFLIEHHFSLSDAERKEKERSIIVD
ncbi:CopG family transcriptional regulator [uncultured Shewanella sp.]|uniref:CopG family transcriptional regulator n=1 Tax=Shewanella atlantica TaxID=271099 RepID=UPI0026321EB7|nr:CopG family transcriptional regulator [uncultured Shewanella sp.]